MDPPRWVRASNASSFTLDGTRTYLVGEARVAVIDPGPDLSDHIFAVSRAVADADEAVLLQTHDHEDHAGAAAELSRVLGAPVLGAGEGARPLAGGDEVLTDRGRLVAVETPGHAARHLAFHWPDGDAAFVGDLLLGEGSTMWVGAYPGCVADFFDSLKRIEALAPSVLYPGHGPPIDAPGEALARYRAHRLRRLAEVRRELERDPGAEPAELVRRIYSADLPPRPTEAAVRSVEAMLHHLEWEPRTDREDGVS